MAVCNVQELLSANPCLAAMSPFMRKAVIVQMLCNLKGNLESGSEITCDIQTLMDDAACFSGLSEDQLETIMAQLLCDISGLVA